MSFAAISPGFIALHSHRAEVLADILTGWLRDHPLAPLESEVVLVQSNGMAEWFKIELARQSGVCAAARVELPSRFLWRTYRQVLGAQHVPPASPLDKLPMTWRLMALLPEVLGDPVFHPVAGYLQDSDPERLLQLASRLADLFDQYQIYRPDWLQDWAAGHDVLRQAAGQAALPADQRWQAELWRRVLATLGPDERASTRPALHARVMERLRSGQPLASAVARRVSVFGMSHMPVQLLELLAALASRSQVMLAVPNPCQYHWGDIMDGREWLQSERRRQAYRGQQDLSAVSLARMHLHAPTLLAAWGRQGRDFIRQLDAFDNVQAAQQLTQLPRLDFFDDEPGEDPRRLLTQLQRRIRDLLPTHEPALPLQADDRSVVFQVAHSPVRELEVLHDQLLQWFHQAPGGRPLSPRDVVVMVPDIERMAPAIRAVFGQYRRSDARYIPFDIADLGAQAISPLIHALEWLLTLPQQRSGMSELVQLLEVPALAARFGIAPQDLPTLMRWMAGSGIRWGLSAEHRAGLGLAMCGEDNTALFGVQRMLMGYACGGDPLPVALGVEPYPEVGGLDAELAGALAHLLQALIDWWQVCTQPGTPLQWAERGRTLLAAMFKAGSDADRSVLAALDQALSDWVQACEEAQFAQPVSLAVARSAWLEALRLPRLERRFRAAGVTFCTLMPMRAIPFQAVCLLGMNDGDYPRRSPPADFDLMDLAGMARPGDRSRRDDDRQLMLEALLSARQVLHVSWSGRSVRDNSEQPPSVLVSQLRDEIDLLWGEGTAAGLTTVHPLQPFGRAYFAEDGRLTTFAHEWRAAQAAPDSAPQPHPSERALPPLGGAQGLPLLTLAQLQAFLRRPVAAFLRQRLLVDLQDDVVPWQDEELFGLDGLAQYVLMDQQLRHLPENMTPEQLPVHLDAAVQRLRRSGALPLAAVGTFEARRLTQELQGMLLRGLLEQQAWPQPAARLPIERVHAGVRLQDSLSGLRSRTQDPATGEVGVQTVWIDWRASRLARVSPGGKLRPLADRLVGAWLTQLAAAASGHALHGVIVGRNVVLRSAPMGLERAATQLDAVLEAWAEGMRWPLPLPPSLAVKWVQARQRHKNEDPALRNALADLYEGNGHDNEGEVSKDRAWQRVYPALDELLAGGHFERLALQVYAPLTEWVQALHAEPVAGAQAEDDDDGQGAA